MSDVQKANGLFRRACTAARTQHLVQQELTKFFTDRYGTTYSDLDLDCLIEAFDYSGDETAPTLKQVDETMTLAGHPPIEGGTND